MKTKPLLKKLFFLFCFLISCSAYSMDLEDVGGVQRCGDKVVQKEVERQREYTDPSICSTATLEPESSSSLNDIPFPEWLSPSEKEGVNSKARADSDITSGGLLDSGENMFNVADVPPQRRLSKSLSYPATRTPTKAITPPRKTKLNLNTDEEFSHIDSHIEENTRIALKKKEEALITSKEEPLIDSLTDNDELRAAAVAMKKEEFNKVADYWTQVAEISSLLQKEKNELQKMIDKQEVSRSLLQQQGGYTIEASFSQDQKLEQDEIYLLEKTIIAHQNMVNFLFQGTSITHEWIHKLWTEHFNFAISSLADINVDDPEMKELEKENCYKNGVSILQILAANHSEDENQKVAAFFARVADSEYKKMKELSQDLEMRHKIMEQNQEILTLCLKLDFSQENCDTIMNKVDQIISDKTMANELNERYQKLIKDAEVAKALSKKLEKVASLHERQARLRGEL